jgi:hypothetical protein
MTRIIRAMAEQVVVVPPTPFRTVGEACGVPVRISTENEEAWMRLRELLPPMWVDFDDGTHIDPEQRIAHFLIHEDGTDFVLRRDDTHLARSDMKVVLHVFDAELRKHIALHSPDRVFVHAGVVGHNGRAIVIPGPSFSGKTSLVAALVKAGATYYSDEYAVLDSEGLVHPFAKRLSIRERAGLGTLTDVSQLGGTAGTEPLPIGLIVLAEYRRDAVWAPRTLSPGEAVIQLVANTIPVAARPQETMLSIRAAVEGSRALALQGERGDAAELAQQLLDSVSAEASRPA